MDFSGEILGLLLQNGAVSIPRFGSFVLETSDAQWGIGGNTISPPSNKIIFFRRQDLDDEGALAKFLSQRNSISDAEATLNISMEAGNWNRKILQNEEFEIPNLGEFKMEDGQLVFIGEKMGSNNSEFYGLEEINLQNLKKPENVHTPFDQTSDHYRFNNSILWIFLVLVPILGLFYIGFTKSEWLFGKKSFNDISIKNSTHRIEKKKSATKDTIKESKSDSITENPKAKVSSKPVLQQSK